MPDTDYAALAAEGRRLLAIADKQDHAWPACECCKDDAHENALAWMFGSIEILLTACERFSLLEDANRKLSRSLSKHSDAVNEQAERLAAAEQRCAELQRAIAEVAVAVPPSVLPPPDVCKQALAEHDAALIEKVRDAILRECDLGPNDRTTVVNTSDIEDVCKRLCDRALKGEL